MEWEHQFCSNYFWKMQKKIMICVSKFVSILWDHFIIDSRKWKSNSFMLNNSTLYEEINKILRTIILFFSLSKSCLLFRFYIYRIRKEIDTDNSGCRCFLQSVENLILDSLTYDCYTKCSNCTWVDLRFDFNYIAFPAALTQL